jgi:hypothetical protein
LVHLSKINSPEMWVYFWSLMFHDFIKLNKIQRFSWGIIPFVWECHCHGNSRLLQWDYYDIPKYGIAQDWCKRMI